MGAIELISVMGHEQVMYCRHKETDLKAIVAIHDTTLGPALGGCRFWNYRDEHEALMDVLRLSRGMTFKAAIAGLHLGGGKAVIIGDPARLKSERFFRAFGRFVNSMSGRYITAEDVNVRVEDMNQVAKETRYVVGISSRPGGSGDPSPVTALGVYHGIKASIAYKDKRTSLNGLTVAVQGCGSVGRNLCKLLYNDGAKLVVSDINRTSTDLVAKEYRAKVVDVNDVHKVEADVYSPCALGAILNERTIPELRAPIVAGAANNQLANETNDGRRLLDRGILYAPDYVINAGGLINVSHELSGYSAELAKNDAKRIYDTMFRVYELAEKAKIPTSEASDELALKRINEVKTIHASKGKEFLNSFDNQDWIKSDIKNRKIA
ncbi:MAG: Glu/Leu/Phe/Val dehydrogenase [Deltaproteobacteria bacterium]|nr:Glu/Leu/Phe/Val dehydrogenase [Deltaproteobacteria bacterium]